MRSIQHLEGISKGSKPFGESCTFGVRSFMLLKMAVLASPVAMERANVVSQIWSMLFQAKSPSNRQKRPTVAGSEVKHVAAFSLEVARRPPLHLPNQYLFRVGELQERVLLRERKHIGTNGDPFSLFLRNWIRSCFSAASASSLAALEPRHGGAKGPIGFKITGPASYDP